MRVRFLALLGVVCALSAAAPSASAASAQPGRITVIGDSVLTAVQWNDKPLSILEQGFPDMDLQIAICRTLTGESCPFDGQRPPNLVDLVHALGANIGATVVVEVGYNDSEDGFADAVDTSIQTLLAAGVQRILWLNYHVWDPRFAAMNTVLAQVASHYPQVTIVDWQSDSFIQYSWFQGDGIHLVMPGALAIAALIHDSLVRALNPLALAKPVLPVARVGQRFTARLEVSGGEAPYQWQVTSGPLPKGLHLLADGTLDGTPLKAGRMSIAVEVGDATGQEASVDVDLLVRPRGSPG